MEEFLLIVLPKIARSLDTKMRQTQFDCKLDKDDLLQGASKRMRIDETYKEELVQNRILEGRAKSAQQASRSEGLYSGWSGTVDRWQHRFLLQYALTLRSKFQSQRCLTVVSDGKRLGQPREETNLYQVYAPSLSLAGWLPPVVPMRASQTTPNKNSVA